MKRIAFPVIIGTVSFLLIPFWLLGVPGNRTYSNISDGWFLGLYVTLITPASLLVLTALRYMHCALIPAKKDHLTDDYVFFANLFAFVATLAMIVAIAKLMS
jgi:hypothetical protein